MQYAYNQQCVSKYMQNGIESYKRLHVCIHFIQILDLPKQMAPGSLWICNVEVNIVHVLVRDRTRIKLERTTVKAFHFSFLFKGGLSSD